MTPGAVLLYILPVQDSITSAILSSISDGVLVFDFAGRLLFSNLAGRELLGLQRDGTSGKRYIDLFLDNPENDIFNDIIFSGIQNHETHVYKEAPFCRPDGDRIDLAVATSFLRARDGVEGKGGIVVVFKDISESKALDRARQRVIDHLSHELNTPLAIIGATLKRLNGPETGKYVERIEHNLGRLKDIQVEVEDIVKGSRGEERDSAEWQDSPALEAWPYVAEVLDLAERNAPDRHVAVNRETTDNPRILMDPDALRKVLMAPMKNAIEATPDGGEIFVSLASRDGEAVVEIRDTGVGITSESRRQIFGGFYHAKDTNLYGTKKPFAFGAGGKGLDLLRLKVLSKAHNFRIECESARCRFIPLETDACPGTIEACSHVKNREECARSGGTTFRLIFPSCL